MHEDDLAARRFMLLNVARLLGLVMVGIGVVIISGRLTDNQALGYFLFVAGAGVFFALPLTLARRWKSPDE